MIYEKEFLLNGVKHKIEHVETLKVVDGVECDVYRFLNSDNSDLGIIRISPGCKTPLQKVLKGDKTTEGYISGNGTLKVISNDDKKVIYEFPHSAISEVEIKIDEIMQWHADKDSSLVVYEICFPPYEDGRFANLEE